MKKLISLLAFAGLINFQVSAEQKHCYTTEENQPEIQNDPQYRKNLEDLEKFTKSYIQNAKVEKHGNRTIYVIPVVFHILHNYGPENITDAQCIDAVNIMTRDYNMLNADTVNVIPEFKQLIANIGVEFRLANIDPNGNCTNGIEHIATLLTYNAGDNSKLDPWPCANYMNIWVANTLAQSGAAAYAHMPGGPNNVDGIMSLYSYVGSIGASSVTNSRTLTHEMGHCFNLSHPWGMTNSPGVACGDDGVADTPITKGWDHCPPGPASAMICNPTIVENYQNYMDYSYCDCMFTLGQKARMLSALNYTASGRNNLWTPANLAATGTDGSAINICTPIADFKADNINICAGTPIQFFDQSWNAPITSWNWSFPGGTPSTSTDSSPAVTFSSAGLWPVTLSVTSSTGSDTLTKTSFIRVTGPALHSVPYTIDFEDTAAFPYADGWIENPDNNVISLWTRVTNASASSPGVASIKINNYTNSDGAVDEWITPSINFSNVNYPVTLTFKVANAQRNSTTLDQLSVSYSDDCGTSWHTPYTKSGATLATVPVRTSSFTPASVADWRLETVNVNGVHLKPNIRFKFTNTSNHGNNTYVDDINMFGNYVGIDELDELQDAFALYPNPTQGTTTVDFNMTRSGVVVLNVKNMLGQIVFTGIDETMEAGMHQSKLPVLTAGVYLVDLTVNNKHHVRKLVVS